MAVDPAALRSCLGHFATGVTVITCDGDGSPHGATVNAFTAVPLEFVRLSGSRARPGWRLGWAT
jgi:flavin reductase (DIM6/NTAB) family NADH-FMN oxidoreductase RutF